VLKNLATWKLGDMFNAEGGANLAVIDGRRCAWKKYCELCGMLARKEMSSRLKGEVHFSCFKE